MGWEDSFYLPSRFDMWRNDDVIDTADSKGSDPLLLSQHGGAGQN